METEEVTKRRKEIEAEVEAKTDGTTELKKEEPKKPRDVRRSENREKVFLDKLVFDFFTKRSASDDPESELVGVLFDGFNREWIDRCKKFNHRREPIKLRYEAFTESVEFYLKMEKDQIIKTAEANKTKDFDYWLRHVKMGEALFFVVLWYKIISFGNREKQLHSLKNYYINHILVKNV